jgi:hypothetical protein
MWFQSDPKIVLIIFKVWKKPADAVTISNKLPIFSPCKVLKIKQATIGREIANKKFGQTYAPF